MIHTIKFIERLNKKGIIVDVEGDKLKIKAEKGIITEKIVKELRGNKQDIISLFGKKQAPLSFAQKRLWFIDQYERNANYNVIGAVKLIGELNQTVLEKTFSEIIRRHEVLRTNFVTINNVARQLIHLDSNFKLQTIDQSHLSDEEANKEIKRLIKIESQKPFDLESDSLIRLVLFKINDDEHTLFLNQHHIISDGWSSSLFFKEISILYRAFSEDKPCPLTELEIQYADYANWQEGQIQGDVFKEQAEYWKNKLSATKILEIPTDKTRPKEQTFNGANLQFSLDKNITEKLNNLCKENDVTLFMTLLSAFKVLLNKYTGQDDICVGSPIANRTRSEIEPLLGFFVNTLALRSNVRSDISFIDLLKQVKQTALDAYASQDIPFEKVVDIIQPERNLSYSPLFQVMMVLQNTPQSELSFGDLALIPVKVESTIAKFDLTLNFTETAAGLVGGIEYNTDLFEKGRIERMIGHLTVLVSSIISNPTVKISDLDILTPEEKEQILTVRNTTKTNLPKDSYILDKNSRLVPLGVPGVLHIGGEQAAQEYLKTTALELEKSIENPFDEGAESRLYKTEDLVQYLPDGNIEFVGKVDDRVSIRGFKIDLGKIEARVREIEVIKDCALVAKEDTDGSKRLVAYVVSDNGLNVEKLRKDLSKLSLDHMVPSIFVRLEKMPFTADGQIDKKALPELEGTIEPKVEFVAPQTETEQKLAVIWQEALGVDKVGIHDNFFELDGHSLLATQIFSKIKSQFNSDLPLKALFESPTIKQLSEKIDTTNIAVGNTETTVVSLPEIVHDEENKYEPFPLTDVQQAYLMGRSNMYTLGNIGTHAYIEIYLEDLDLEKFNYALNFLIKRHDMLRMVITEAGQQKILAEVEPYNIPLLNLRNKSKHEGEAAFYQLRNELSHQIFDGFTWPLFDIRTSRFWDGSYKVHFSIDALIFDGASGNIFLQELMFLYNSQVEKLLPIGVTFRDYVMAEQSMRDTALYQNSRDYWLNRIENFPEKPELPLAMSPKKIKSPKFDRRTLYLEAKIWDRLQSSIKKSEVTPTVFFIECFGQIIEKWSKNNHFVLNLTLFNRLPLHEDVNKVIGDFTSLTILEMDYRTTKTFIQRLKATHAQLWDDIEHKHFSGVEVQRELSRIKGEVVTFPVVVTSVLSLDTGEYNESEKAFRPNEQKLQLLDEIQQDYSITQTSQVWLDYKITKYKGGINIEWDFVEGLFPEGMIDDMFTAFESLLHALSMNQAIWGERNTISIPDEQQELQNEANATSTPISSKLMHELFVDQVRNNQKRIAVKSNGKVLSYGELYNISQNIGAKLKELEAKPNKLIAILMHKGWEQVAAALGIQFSGAAYLPIEASLPRERITRLIEIGQVEIVVSVSSVFEDLKLSNNLKKLALDEIKYEETLEIEQEYYQKSEDLAYVIFTSGSTGDPKGVVIDHRGAVNTILDINNRFDITEKDSCFAISSLSFDLSVYDIFGMLSVGGTIVIPEPSEQKDPGAWARYITNEEITIWNSVPALMQMLVEYAGERDLDSPLRKILLSGDWIPVSLPDKIKRLSPDIEVFSLGGATEASIWSIYYPIRQVHPEWKSIPYGKPLSNQSFHVLKSDLTTCPLWVTGDLYIGGTGLAVGYWRDKKKTTSSFITLPETDERLYKTGDMGRYLPDGNIEFLGREDTQVKVQGYRIELGEIEYVLEEHEKIERAVVDVREIRNTKRIVAYLIDKNNVENSDDLSGLEQELRGYLGDKLPDYMVPSHYSMIEAVPVTANGKVNRKALPDPKLKDGQEAIEYKAPSNEAEEKLVKIIQEILGDERIGINDNFFELGLTSIQVVGLNSAVKKEMNIELEIVDLFVFTTIKKLSDYIKGKELTEDDSRNDEIDAGKKNYKKLLKRRI
ncbi:amino acid adenylation domain-containing protein [Croceitalea marina]|uniref:Amino acid adenylation domain-containing protein n=1 Tax=Croceitalea marina TaxID=1775166 RepID=A0ABW5MRZ8_9FLAO